MPDDLDELRNELASLGQRTLAAPPLIILGSGASMAYGVGGMGDLAAHLEATVVPAAGTEETTWNAFKTELANSRNLETSLQKITLPDRLLGGVVKATHHLVARDDRTVLERVIKGEITLALTHLFRHLFQSTHKRIGIVTTNYDRLAEYAANVAGFSFYTGFTAGIYGLFDDRMASHPHGRTVNVWKVHGSIDWFEDHQRQPIAVIDVPLGSALNPLIVTPGTTKYQQALAEPFRTILGKADDAMSTAAAFICVGFGFRDTHVEPKLVRRLRQKKAPFVVLARTLTEEAKKFLKDNVTADFLAMEHCATGTRAYTAKWPTGREIAIADLWTLDGFLDAALGNDK